MKKRYNRFTTTDLPFDTYTDSQIEIVKNESTTTPTKREQRHKERIKEKLNSKNTETKTSSSTENLTDAGNEEIRRLKEINNENLRNYRFKSRRNRVIIITLIILLILAIAGIAIYAVTLELENNCFIHAYGDASVSFIVDDTQLSRFRTPNGIQGNRVYKFDLDVKIKSNGKYNVRFTIKIYQNGELLENTFIYSYNHELFYSGEDGYCYSYDYNPISKSSGSGGVIDLCGGVAIDDNEATLNIDNFKMEILVYFDEVE